MTEFATIDQLRPGQEYPDGNINARQHYTTAEIEELAASLLPSHDGQLRPFFVATHPTTPSVYYVFGGGRRRLAYIRMIERGELLGSHAIEIKDFGNISVSEALSKSWADNKAVPMHPADLAATFAALAADRPVEEIAAEHGITVLAANRHIALGTRLSPEVIADWRAGLLKREAIEIFAATDDHEAQDAALLWAKTQWSWAHNGSRDINLTELRRKLTGNKEPEMKRLLGFVGKDRYRAAGGVVTDDFFGEGGMVKDLKLLKKVAKAKMDELLDALRADGWSWAEGKMRKSNMHHGYGQSKIKAEPLASEMIRQSEIEDRLAAINDMALEEETLDGESKLDAEQAALTAENARIQTKALLAGATKNQKSKAGVIVSVRDDGSLHYDIGLIRREDTKADSKDKPHRPGQQREERDTTGVADRHVTNCTDEALAELLVNHPKELFALFLTSAARDNTWNDPFRADSVACKKASPKAFDKLYHEFVKLSPGDMIKAAAEYICYGAQAENDGTVDPVIMSIIGEAAFQKLVAAKFDPKIYFEGASKRFLLGVIAETFGEVARAAGEKSGDEEVRDEVIAAVKKTGWLPPDLRTASYSPPTPLESAIAAHAVKPTGAKKSTANRRAA